MINDDDCVLVLVVFQLCIKPVPLILGAGGGAPQLGGRHERGEVVRLLRVESYTHGGNLHEVRYLSCEFDHDILV